MASMPLPAITVRFLTADEWPTLKLLRIRALTDSPDSFGTTVADVVDQPDGYWQTWARRANADDARVFAAFRDADPLGLGSAVRDPNGVGHIGAMWADPAVRGTGVGRRIFEAGCKFLAGAGCRRIELWVTDGNERAEGLYRSRGFVRTGKREPLREGSPLWNVEMAWKAEESPSSEGV